ncbi:MAG: hypothetical protein U0837_14760 [Dehalococcoidia bacterium]|jgi:hypothetical protein
MAEIDEGLVRSSESVHRWMASRLGLWGRSSVTENLVETLAVFCNSLGLTPDEMIDDCLKPGKDREVFTLRTKARRKYIDEIDRFELASGSRDEANIVRSFFIHNGVAMNPSILV